MSFAPLVLAGVQAGAQIWQGHEQNKASRRAARAEEENARLTQLQGSYDIAESLRAARLQMGEDAAMLAGSGSQFNTGSIADALEAASVEAQLGAMRQRYSAESDAANRRAQARQYRREGRSALVAGFIGAATSALAGVMQHQDNRRLGSASARDRASRTSRRAASTTPSPAAAVPRPRLSGGGTRSYYRYDGGP